ncbi:hypothetical protein HGQ98_02495 [Achromobacter ruhlandii]|uniref:Uncharacterized protein n=1 Tax=Achromobacter ruhlandii TaxID=72557 RepID=A0A848NAZ2_9BURK|nr:hypothetical protein [Achromobacter ruhlandii]NMU88756.1 hypothetical protein [Achromobacter ruhlandii]
MELNEKGTRAPSERVGAGKSLLEVLDIGFSVLYKFAVGTGAIVLLVYFGTISFYPALSIGEVVLLVFMAVMFGFVYALSLGYGVVSALWVVTVVEFTMRLFGQARENPGVIRRRQLRQRVRRGKRRRAGLTARILRRLRGYMRRARLGKRAVRSLRPAGAKGLFPLGISVLCFALFAMLFVLREEVRAFLAGALFAGFALLLIGGSILREEGAGPITRKQIAKRLFLALIGSTVVFTMISGAFVPASMAANKLGLRSVNRIVEISDAESRRLLLISEALGFPVFDCRTTTPGSVLLHHVDVLWHGVGDKSRLQFVVPGERKPMWDLTPAKSWKEAAISVEAKSTSIVDTSPGIASCLPYHSGSLFLAGAAEMSDSGNLAMHALQRMARRMDFSGKIDVFVFVDRAVALDLGESRAAALGRALETALPAWHGRLEIRTRVLVGQSAFQLLPSTDVEIWIGGAPQVRLR